MSFSRHGQIYQSDVLFRPRSGALAGSAPGFIVLTSLRPAIPRQVGLHQSPPPLHRLKVIFNPSAETVNHHPTRAGEFSTGEMRNFQPALTSTFCYVKIPGFSREPIHTELSQPSHVAQMTSGPRSSGLDSGTGRIRAGPDQAAVGGTLGSAPTSFTRFATDDGRRERRPAWAVPSG
jgi:hypothetical protein